MTDHTQTSPALAASNAENASPSEAKPSRRQVLSGVKWMIVSTLMFVAVTGIVRYLGSDLPAAQAAFIRYAFGFIIMSPAILRLIRSGEGSGLWGLFALRGFLHSLGVILWFFAMARIPIAEVTAIGYVSPIMITIGAALFLGEKLRIRRLAGVFAGLIGALIILRPGFQEISIGQLAQLGAAPLFAASYLMTKSLTGRTSSAAIVTGLTIFCTLFLFPFALVDWQTPGLKELFWLFVTALCATFGHYAMTRALNAAPVSVTQPITFLQLVWATMLGTLMFGEEIDVFVLLGGSLIVGAATFISHREAKMAKEPITPPASAAKLQ